MKSRANMVAAIIAVALMMGCALVPLACENVNGETGATANDGASTGFSLYDIINKLNGIGRSESFDIGNGVSLVPVDDEVGDPSPIGTEIKGQMLLDSGDYELNSSESYVFSSNGNVNGRITIASGANIVFMGDKDQKFTIVNKNDSLLPGHDIMVEMLPGSRITFLGIQFMVMYQKTETGPYDSVHPIKVGFTGGVSESPLVFEWKEGVAKVKTGKGIYASIFGKLTFEYNGDNEKSDIEITLKTGSNSLDGNVKTYLRNGSNLITTSFAFGLDLNIEIIAFFDQEKGVLSYDSAVTVSFKITEGSMEIENDNGMTISVPEFTVTDSDGDAVVIKKASKIVMDFPGPVKFQTEASDVTMPENDVICMNASSIVVDFEIGIGMHLTFTLFDGQKKDDLKGAVIALDKINRHADYTYDSEGGRTGSDVGNLELSVTAPVLEVSGTALFFTLDALYIKEFSLLTDVTITYGKTGATTDFNLFTVSGDSISDSVAGELLGKYDIKFSMTAVGLKTVTEKESTVTTGDFLATLSTRYNGMDRFLTLSIEGFKKTIGKESNVTEIGKIHFKNELPLKQILKNIRDIGDDHEMELTAEGLRVKDGSIEIRTIDFYYRNMNVLDELYAKFDGAQLIYNEDDAKYDVFGKTVNGYLLDNGVKSGFAMNDVRFRAGLADNHEYNALHLISGDVDFYDGGALPLHLVIGEGVNFKANGLKVITLVSNSTEMKGTVAIDTSDGTFTSDPVRYVNLNGYNFLVYQEIDGVGAGGIVSFDLQPTHDGKYGGTITPCANHVLPTLTPSPRESDNIEYSLSGGILKFRIILDEPGKAIVRCVCPGNEFNLSYDGMSGEPKTVSTGAIVKLGTFLPQGVELWTDGSGKIYNRTDSYSMPARDVCFKPVSMKTASGFDEKSVEGKSVIDAKGSDVVAIGTDLTPNKDVVEIIVSGATIDMTKSTYQTIVEQVVGGGNVYIKALVVETVSTEDDRTVYDISITDKDGKSVEYDGSTSFTVTLNVAVSGHVEDIAVSYLDEYGHSHSVGVGSWQRCDDGTYDVTFEANHFSNYVVEPKISGSSDGSKIDVMVVVTAAIVIAIGLLVAYISFSSGKSEKTEDKSEDKSEDDSADSPKKVPKKKMRSV